ncbi:MAG TPA: hypothetical protein VJ570_04850, partial [Holophagaceae bacterium]|nr:hypothetical protein [Holophagaceae bacterium]
MRLKALISNALLGIATLSLSAQVDPKLKTVTDLSDVYKRAAGLPRLVTIYDFTPPSRGVFEHKSYLTGASRTSFLASGPSVEKPSVTPNVDASMAALFNPAGLSNSSGPKDMGIVFGIRKYSTPTGAGVMRVFMYWWPSGTQVLDPKNGNNPIVGIPMQSDPATGAMSEVTLGSTADSVTTYFNKIDHVRFTAFVDNAATPVNILSGLTFVPMAEDSHLQGVYLPGTTTQSMATPVISGISNNPIDIQTCFQPNPLGQVYINGNNFIQTTATWGASNPTTSTVKVQFYDAANNPVGSQVSPTTVTNTLIVAPLPAALTQGSTFTVRVIESLANSNTGQNKVTISNSPQTSSASPVGTVVGNGPTINLGGVTPSTNIDPTVANTFTIQGANFSATPANNTITLLNSTGGVVGTYTPSSATTTSLSFTRPAGAIPDGTYNLQVKVSGGSCASSSGLYPITIKNPVISSAGIKVRVMDLPCPTLIFDSPTSVTDPNVKQSSSINFNGDNIKFDPWSEGHLSAGVIGASNDVMVGNFFYSPDYLAWVFGGQVIRSTNCVSSQISVSWASAGSVNKGGFAIPGSTLLAAYYPAALGLNSLTLNDGLEGWSNGLPVQTRYQVAKSASITAYLNHYGGMQWVYRFLDGAYDDDTLSEELGRTTTSASATSGSKGSLLGTTGSATDTAPDDPFSSNNATPHLRHLRSLSPITGGAPKGDTSYLVAGTTSLQVYGPKALAVGTSLQQAGGNEPFGNMDPHTPEPIAWALANTYRQILDSTVFGAAQKCARTFVIPFPTRGMNDASVTALDFGGATGYKAENNGTGYKTYGGVTLGNISSGNKEFAPWDISSVAAHDTTSSNSGLWKAPWNPDFTNTDPTNRIQTMVISLGIPGAFNFTDSHSDHQGSHVEYFKIAQFADPGRANWDPSSDSSRLDNCTTNAVFYYPAASPKDVNDALGDALSYIVQASAALSAPATPATGVRNANEAYFGTFQTTSTIDSADRLTLWSGNLYALGLDRVFDPTTNTTILEFYGADNQPFSPDLSNTIADYDTHNLWSAYGIFGKYQPAPPITRPAVSTSKLISGKALLWSSRNLLMMVPSGSGYTLQKYDASESSTTQLDAIAKAAGIAAGATPTAADEGNAA